MQMEQSMTIQSKEKVPTGYQLTEVGVIPEDWTIQNVSQSSTIKARIGWQGLTKNEYLDIGDYILITGTDFFDGKINWESCSYVDENRWKQDKNIQIQPGDVLITKDGTIGKVAFVKNIPKPATLNSGVFVIRPRYSDHSPRYLFYIFNSIYFKIFLDKLVAGSTISHLYQKDFIDFDFPIPPTLAEQTAIATALSDMDALIEAQEALLAKKRALKQGAMQELLTGKRRLVETDCTSWQQTEVGRIPGDWEVVALSNACYMKSGETITSQRIDSTGKYPCYGGNGLRGYTDRYTHQGEYTLIGRQGALCGNVQFVRGSFYASEHAVVVAPKHKTNIKWLSYILERMQLNQYSESSAQPGISVKKIYKLPIPFPPTLAEQAAIATALSDMDTEIEQLEAQLAKYRQLKRGMMQELLTGRKRLI